MQLFDPVHRAVKDCFEIGPFFGGGPDRIEETLVEERRHLGFAEIPVQLLHIPVGIGEREEFRGVVPLRVRN